MSDLGRIEEMKLEIRALKILLGRCLPYVADYTAAEDIELSDAIDKVLAGPDSPLVPPGTIEAIGNREMS